MGRVARLVGIGLLALPVIAVLGWVFYSRAAFGTWNPMAQPTRISYCDRTYIPGSHVTRAQIDAEVNSFGVSPLRQVGSTADGKLIFSKPMPENVRHNYPNAAPLVCSMVVYLKVGPDAYIAYGLNGGP
jgi:hypothetical protein